MNVIISDYVRDKILRDHKVVEEEVKECFINRKGKAVRETRLQHQTNPPTVWFVARTFNGRLLKVVFIRHRDGSVELKTAFEPMFDEVKLYEQLTGTRF